MIDELYIILDGIYNKLSLQSGKLMCLYFVV